MNEKLEELKAAVREAERLRIENAILRKLREIGEQINGYEDTGYGGYEEEINILSAEARGLYMALDIIEGKEQK